MKAKTILIAIFGLNIILGMMNGNIPVVLGWGLATFYYIILNAQSDKIKELEEEIKNND